MAVTWTFMISLALIAVAQAHEQYLVSSDNNETKNMITAMSGFSHVLECFGGMVQESLRLHTENNGKALNDFGDLLRESLKSQNHNSDFLKLEALQKVVEELTRENGVQKLQLAEKDKEVQSLKKKLMEAQKLPQGLQEQETILNNTESSLNETSEELPACGPLQDKIKKEVEEYSRTRDLEALKRCLQAVLGNQSEACRQLLDIATDSYVSPLYEVANRGYTDLVNLLLCHGLPVDLSGSNMFSMLHGAAHGGRLEMVKLLLRRGADVDGMDQKRTTPLMMAVSRRHEDVVQWLLKAGADVTLRDDNGVTARDKARGTPMEKYLS